MYICATHPLKNVKIVLTRTNNNAEENLSGYQKRGKKPRKILERTKQWNILKRDKINSEDK